MVDTCANSTCTSAACPVCGVVLPFVEINTHIDACLSSAGRDALDRQDRDGGTSRPLLKSPSGARGGRQALLPFGGHKRHASLSDEPYSKSRKIEHTLTMEERSPQLITR